MTWPEDQILVEGESATLGRRIGYNLKVTASILEKANANKPDMTQVKKVFRFPHLSLSQDRMGIVKEKYGTKITRKKEDADLWVISAKYLQKMTNYKWNVNLVTFTNAKKWYDKFNHLFTDEAKKYLDESFTTLNPESWIELDVPNWGIDNDDLSKSRDFLEKLESDVVSQPYTMNMSDWNTLQELIDSDKLISDVAMNDITSEDSVILDKESYNNIEAMLKANGKEDKAVAMSLMANCRINESHTWLGILFYDYSWAFKGTKMWNQVAFKTLRDKFADYIDYASNHSYEKNSGRVNILTELLYKHGALSKDAIEMLKDRMHEAVLDYIDQRNSKIFYTFSRKDIKLRAKKEKNTEEGVEALV